MTETRVVSATPADEHALKMLAAARSVAFNYLQSAGWPEHIELKLPRERWFMPRRTVTAVEVHSDGFLSVWLTADNTLWWRYSRANHERNWERGVVFELLPADADAQLVQSITADLYAVVVFGT